MFFHFSHLVGLDPQSPSLCSVVPCFVIHTLRQFILTVHSLFVEETEYNEMLLVEKFPKILCNNRTSVCAVANSENFLAAPNMYIQSTHEHTHTHTHPHTHAQACGPRQAAPHPPTPAVLFLILGPPHSVQSREEKG